MWSIKDDKGYVETFKKMNIAWKQFKSDLYNKYVLTEKNPCLFYTWLDQDKYEEFKRQRSTDEYRVSCAKPISGSRIVCRREESLYAVSKVVCY